jgi:hypothetical protein
MAHCCPFRSRYPNWACQATRKPSSTGNRDGPSHRSRRRVITDGQACRSGAWASSGNRRAIRIENPSGDDFAAVLSGGRRRPAARRGSLHHQLRLDPLPFWEEVELLLGNSRSPRLPETQGEPARRGKVADVLFDELQLEVARELLREPGARGLVYVGGPVMRADLPIVRGLDVSPSEFAPRVYLLGKRGDLSSHPTITPVFLEGDEHLARHEFLLWLGDGLAYALLQRRGRGATWGFHTSDPTLVEGLVSKLQAAYDLQPS